MKHSLQEILLIIAKFYKYPDELFFKSLQSGAVGKRWKEHLTELNFNKKDLNLKHQFNSLEHMKTIYQRCFIGPSMPFYPPIESLYKVWTDDPTANSAIANKTGYLLGDPAIHMAYLYHQYNLEVPEQYKNMPDHLGLQVEFLTFLMDHCTSKQLELFIDDHFDWLLTFKNKLKLVKGSEFYIWVTSQLEQTIDFIRLESCKVVEGV